MVLKVKWEVFKYKIEESKFNCNSIVKKSVSSNTEDELIKLKEDKNSLGNAVVSYVRKSFEPENRSFVNDFKVQRGFNTGFKLHVLLTYKGNNKRLVII